MTLTANTRPAGRHDHDIYDQHGQYIGSAKTALAAQVKADGHRLETLQRGAPVIEPDPLELYAGVPQAATTVQVESLARAYAHFQARHAERMERSGQRLSTPDEDLITRSIANAFAAVQQRTWEITPDGVLQITGSKGDHYRVSDEGCALLDPDTGEQTTCRSQHHSRRRHGGECYHTICRELIRLAQVFAEVAAPVVPLVTEQSATCSLNGKLLGHSLAILACAEGEPITFTVLNNRLKIFAGDERLIHAVALQAATVGTGQMTLDASAFGALWSAFRPVAVKLTSVELHITESGVLTLKSADGAFTFTVQGYPSGDKHASPKHP